MPSAQAKGLQPSRRPSPSAEDEEIARRYLAGDKLREIYPTVGMVFRALQRMGVKPTRRAPRPRR